MTFVCALLLLTMLGWAIGDVQFYVDSVAGSDSNSGSDPARPLQSFAALSARISQLSAVQAVFANVTPGVYK